MIHRHHKSTADKKSPNEMKQQKSFVKTARLCVSKPNKVPALP